MANKQLTAKVRLNTKDAEKSIEALIKKINKINTAVNKINVSNNIEAGMERSVKSTGKLNNKLHETNALVKSIGSKLKMLASTYLGIMGTKAIINTSDTITQAENRINVINGGDEEATQLSMDKMFASSQKVHMNYTDMMSNVSKSMTLAGDAFDNNIDAAIRFQEIMAETYSLGGASDAEKSSSMYQLVQALGSGTLAGDELRSVREGAPLAYRAIEEFVQGIYDCDTSLKELASDGLVTSEMVVAAIMKNGDAIDNQFKNNAITFRNAWADIKNVAIKSFEPILQQLNDLLNSDVGRTMINGITTGIQIVASAVQWLINIFAGFFTWCIDNWNTISRVLLTVATIIGGVLLGALITNFNTIVALIKQYVLLGLEAVKSAIKAMAAWLAANWVLALVIGVLVAIIIVLVWVSDSFADACGIVLGVIMTALAVVWNAFVGIVNAIVDLAWTALCEPIMGIIEFMLNACMGGFDSFGDGVKNLIGNIISWFLSLGKVVTKIVDAIFGTDWTGGLNDLKSDLESWGKNENAITLDREAPTVLDRVDYGDAYNTGYEWGYEGASWITDKISNLSSLIEVPELPSYNSDEYSVTNSYTDPTAEELLGNIEGNVGDIADSMDLTNDDLEYLRKIADMEWRNEFTTAEIKVDMTNNNTINSDRNIDGIVEYLSDVLKDEMNNVAYGVHY